MQTEAGTEVKEEDINRLDDYGDGLQETASNGKSLLVITRDGEHRLFCFPF
jgi:hypothetical protein